MTIKEITEKILEIEKRYGVVIYFTYEPLLRRYDIRMVYRGMNYYNGIAIDAISRWTIDDFNAKLEEMVDYVFKFKVGGDN